MSYLDTATAREWARIAHREDDPAIAIAAAAAEAELELRTGWVVTADTERSQHVESYPAGGRVLAWRQPVTLAVDAATDEELDLITINGLTYFELTGEETYPVTVTLTCGGGIDSVNALLRAALLTRVAQLTAYRGDDTAPPADTYWNNICTMMGKGIA